MCIRDSSGIAHYPMTIGTPALRETIAGWLCRRHRLAAVDPGREVLPVLGSREALFSFAQTVLDPTLPGQLVVMPNPFYQIYDCLLYTSPSPRDRTRSRMPSSA